MTEATYMYYATSIPGMEVFDCTTAPTNGMTITSRKFVNPKVVGCTTMEAHTVGTDDATFSVSGNVVTITVNGTAKKILVTLIEGV